MNDILNKAMVLVLNLEIWQAINIRTPADAFCQMATNSATALEIEGESFSDPSGDVGAVDQAAGAGRPTTQCRRSRGTVRVPTVIVAVNYARVPKKRPKLCARTIRERDGNRCQYTGVLLHPDEGNLDHVVPRSRGGADTWENLVWSSKAVNSKKGNRHCRMRPAWKLLNTPHAALGTAGIGVHPAIRTGWRSGNCFFRNKARESGLESSLSPKKNR